MVRERTGVPFVAVVISASMISVVSASAPGPNKARQGGVVPNQQVGGRTLNGNVSASNVIIDLHGFSIIGPGSGVGVGINAGGANNVTVENGSVTNIGGSGIKVGENGVRNFSVIGNGTGSGLGGRAMGSIASGRDVSSQAEPRIPICWAMVSVSPKAPAAMRTT